MARSRRVSHDVHQPARDGRHHQRDMQVIVGREVDKGDKDWFEETDNDDELDEEQEKLEKLVLMLFSHSLDHLLGDNSTVAR